MRSSITVIYNPAARRASAEKIKKALVFLRKKGFDPELLMTVKRGDAESFAREAVSGKPYAVIAAGGDGTINEVINGMVWSDIPLAVLPLGTTNVLAKELGIPEDPEGAMETAVTSAAKTVSLGKIMLSSNEPSPLTVTRYFCLMAGIGFDAKSVHDINTSIKKVSGKGAYILSGIRSVMEYPAGEILFRIDGREYSGYSAFVCKASRYGGNFRAAPDANLLDPALYVCIFKGARRIDLLRYISGVVRGTHLKYDDVLYLKSEVVEVLGHAHVQTDGDYLGMSPATISVAENSLRIIW
jgi:YegS/Rv2252/BmrU family lipid kinase